MTTISEDTAAVSALAAELEADKNALSTKCQRMIPLATALCERIAAEAPEIAPQMTPLIDGLKSVAASLCGQLQ